MFHSDGPNFVARWSRDLSFWARYGCKEIPRTIPAIKPGVHFGRKLTCEIIGSHLHIFQHVVEADRGPPLWISNLRYLRLRFLTIARSGASHIDQCNQKRISFYYWKRNTNGVDMIPVLAVMIFFQHQTEAKMISPTPSKFICPFFFLNGIGTLGR